MQDGRTPAVQPNPRKFWPALGVFGVLLVIAYAIKPAAALAILGFAVLALALPLGNYLPQTKGI